MKLDTGHPQSDPAGVLMSPGNFDCDRQFLARNRRADAALKIRYCCDFAINLGEKFPILRAMFYSLSLICQAFDRNFGVVEAGLCYHWLVSLIYK